MTVIDLTKPLQWASTRGWIPCKIVAENSIQIVIETEGGFRVGKKWENIRNVPEESVDPKQ